MSANQNEGSQSQKNPTAAYLHPVAISEVGEEMEPVQPQNEDNLLPTDQRDDYLLPTDQRNDYLLPTDQRDNYLEPTDQRDDGYEQCHVYEDLDSYTQQSQLYDEISLSVIPPCPPRPGEQSTTAHRAHGSELGGSGGYLEIIPTPAERPQPARSSRTNKTIKWFVLGLAVFAVIGVVIGITVTYTTGSTTGNGATGHCISMPCKNAGTCHDIEAGFTCQCVTGYSGDMCQHDIDECVSGPCINLGTCEDRVNGYACHCLPGYSGASCQTDTDECESGPCSNGRTCEDRVNGYTCLCRPGYGGANCQSSQVAFSVYQATTTVKETYWRRVEYMETRTDLGGAYHNSTFHTPSTDLYYVAMSFKTWKDTSYRLAGAPHSLGLTALSTNLFKRTLGRSCLLEIPSRGEIGIQYTGELVSGSSTTWSMFSVTAAFHPLVAFTVTRTTPTTELGKVNYRESLVNIGDAFRPADSHFVAPYNGSYLFTVSAGVAAGQKARLHIVKNDVRQVELLYTDTTNNGNEMISSAAIVKLSPGDRVHVELVEGSLYSGPEIRETSFSGFLYSPLHGQSIAWSVWRTDSFSGIGADLEPVPYDTVVVNEGGSYSTSEHVVTVPVSGVYCVYLVGGAPGGGKMTMMLRYGRSFFDRPPAAVNIYDWDTGRNGEVTISHSVLLTLEAGDLVWVKASGRTGRGLYSNPGLVTGFSGFLVYPT